MATEVGESHLFTALLAGGNTLSMRSSMGTAEPISSRPLPLEAAEVTTPVASPGPPSVVSPAIIDPPTTRRPIVHASSAADRSTRYHQSSTSRLIEPHRRPTLPSPPTLLRTDSPIVSERVAAGGDFPVSSMRRSAHNSSTRKRASLRSATISSNSDLSEIEKRHRRRHSRRPSPSSSSDASRRHHSHKSSSRRRTESRRAPAPPVVERSHRSTKKKKATRAPSTSSSSSDSSRERRRRRKHRHSEKPSPSEEVAETCGRCTKTLMIDPLDPAISGLSSKRKERIRQEIVRRIQRMKRNNPAEDINLPVRGLDDPAVCYRRYKRIARHLYAKKSITSYRIMVFIFIFIVQVAMSIMFGSAAAEYLKKEYDQISKYDSVFYEMGCRAYSPYSAPQSPEYRFAYQLVVPIALISISCAITRYTPVPPIATNMFMNMASTYLKGDDSTEYRTLLHEDDNDEPDESDHSSGDESDTRVPHRERRSARPRVIIPDLEVDLPADNIGATAIQAAVPGLVNMITSLRAQPDGTQAPNDGSGMIGTLMNLAQTMMRGNQPAPAARAPPPKIAESVVYAD